MRRWLPWILVAVVIQATVLLLVWRSGREATERAFSAWGPTPPVAVRTLPRLSARDGREVDLAAAGRPTLVYVWGSWCEPCVRHMPDTLALATELRADLDVWLVARDASWDAVAKHFGGDVPAGVVLDPEGRFGDALGVTSLPTSFLVDATGHVVARNLDLLSDADAIRAALAAHRTR